MMAGHENKIGGGWVTVKEYAEHSGRMPDTLAQLGRKAGEWCRRKGLPTGEAEEDGRRVKTYPDSALRDVF